MYILIRELISETLKSEMFVCLDFNYRLSYSYRIDYSAVLPLPISGSLLLFFTTRVCSMLKNYFYQ